MWFYLLSNYHHQGSINHPLLFINCDIVISDGHCSVSLARKHHQPLVYLLIRIQVSQYTHILGTRHLRLLITWYIHPEFIIKQEHSDHGHWIDMPTRPSDVIIINSLHQQHGQHYHRTIARRRGGRAMMVSAFHNIVIIYFERNFSQHEPRNSHITSWCIVGRMNGMLLNYNTPGLLLPLVTIGVQH